MRIRAAVLEQTGGALIVEELELAPPGPGEVLVRLQRERHLPLRPERDRRHRPGPAARPCSATRAPASSRRSARACAASPSATTSRSRGRRRAASAPSACASCRTCARPRGRRWGSGRLLDGTSRLSRDGETVYHYSFISSFAEACVAARALVRADPARRAVRGRRPRRLRRSRPGSARSGGPPACAPASASRSSAAAASGCRRCSARSRPAPGRSSRSTSAQPKLDFAARARRDRRPCCGPGSRRGDRRGRARGQRRRRRLRDRGDRAHRGDARRVPLDARARRRGADRDPARRTRCCRCRRSRSRAWSAACSARSTARPTPSATSR